MRMFRIFFTLMMLFSCLQLQAQDDMKMRQIYSQAESDLKTGRTEESRDTLLHHLNAFRGTLKRDALRIIAMSCISDYDERQSSSTWSTR